MFVINFSSFASANSLFNNSKFFIFLMFFWVFLKKSKVSLKESEVFQDVKFLNLFEFFLIFKLFKLFRFLLAFNIFEFFSFSFKIFKFVKFLKMLILFILSKTVICFSEMFNFKNCSKFLIKFYFNFGPSLSGLCICTVRATLYIFFLNCLMLKNNSIKTSK